MASEDSTTNTGQSHGGDNTGTTSTGQSHGTDHTEGPIAHARGPLSALSVSTWTTSTSGYPHGCAPPGPPQPFGRSIGSVVSVDTFTTNAPPDGSWQTVGGPPPPPPQRTESNQGDADDCEIPAMDVDPVDEGTARELQEAADV